MAHRIEEMDIQEGIEMAWHGLTKVNPQLSLDDNFLTRWDVEPSLIYGADGVPIETAGNEFEESGKWSVLRCSDNGVYIGKPFFSGSYSPITNKRFLDCIRESLAGTGHTVMSLGSVCNRGRIFISIKLQGLEKFESAGREFEPYLNFGSSHDMSCVFFANTSNTCTVCNNTFTANLFHQGKAVNARIKHTKNAPERLDNLPQIIDAAIGVQFEFALALNSFSRIKCNDEKAERYFTGFLVRPPMAEIEDTKPDEILSTRTRNNIERLGQLFGSKSVGNRGEDLSDIFSAMTDYYSHESSGGENRMKQFVSSEFGTGLRRKTEFFEILRDEEKREALETRGNRIMELAS